jgi:hypothetical protein
MRFDGARTSRMPTDTDARFCWNSMPRSIVTSTSYSVPIRRRRSPFVMPVQPRRTTVSTLWPPSAAARSTGTCSSRRTRTSQQRSPCEVERRDCLVAFHGRELAQKLVQGLAAFEVIEQRPDWNACADEHRCAPEDVWVAVYDVAKPGHASGSVYTRSYRAYNSGIEPTAFGRS